MRREWIEISVLTAMGVNLSSLPPCGGSGLKWLATPELQLISLVSLHAEGVD